MAVYCFLIRMRLYYTGFILFLSLQLTAQSRLITTFQTDNYGGPSLTIAAGNKLFFSAYDSLHGRELWCTDGTTAGTFMVKDINPGSFNGIGDYFTYTAYVMNGTLYFKGDDGIFGWELWRSDGTVNGTYLVQDLTPGSSSSGFGYFTSANNILYFTGGTGSQLWRSDGTTAGTYVLAGFTIITNLCAFNGNIYFAADQNNSGQELWKSNGTSAGTFLLKDLNGAFGASLPCNFHTTPSALYFMASTNDGWELWKTTGSNASTVMVKDINPTGDAVLTSYAEASMVNIADTVYFRAQDGVNGFQLWKSDGTSQGTMMCTNIPNGIYSSCTFPIVNGKVLVNNYIDPYFYEYNSLTNVSSASVYPSFFYINDPSKFIFVGDKMIFAAKDSIYGCEVWKADGNTAVVDRIQETYLSDNWYSSPSQGFNAVFGVIGDTVLFTNVRTPYTFDVALFRYDTTQPDSCFAPSILVATPTSDTSAHFVWNRTDDIVQYEFQYRLAGNSSWTTLTTNKSYLFLNNLDSAADYEYQLRKVCNGIPTVWSDVQSYNSGLISDYGLVNMLAERSENDSTERLYWLRSTQIMYAQIRYRINGTSTWATAVSYDGYKRITGLQPNTLYEYQVRPYYTNSTFGVWSNSPLYFYVSSTGTTSFEEFTSPEDIINIFPIPSSQFILIDGLEGETNYKIFDLASQLVRSGIVQEDKITIEELSKGIYFIQLEMDNKKIIKKIVKT